jgi:hypothetical protein
LFVFIAAPARIALILSLGIQTYVGSKSLARFCCEFLNLQRLAESVFSKLDRPNEAQTRQLLFGRELPPTADELRFIEAEKGIGMAKK